MSVKVWTGKVQNEREINAVRIKEKLHIFTGTYPLYYKGDGKLYMYPKYEPNIDQILRFGHNMMVDDFDKLYEVNKTVDELDSKECITEFDSPLRITEFDYIPKFSDQETPINMRVSYERPKNNQISRQFLPINYKGYYENFEPFKDGISLNDGDVIYVNDIFPIPDFGAETSPGKGFLKVNGNNKIYTVNPSETVKISISLLQCPVASGILKVERQIFQNIEGQSVPVGFETIYENGQFQVTGYNEDESGACKTFFRSSANKLFLFKFTDNFGDFFSIEPFTPTQDVIKNTFDSPFRVTITTDKYFEWFDLSQLTPLDEVFVRVSERAAAGELGLDASDWQEVEDYTSTRFSNAFSPFIRQLDVFEGDNVPLTNFLPYNSTDVIDVNIPRLQAIGTNRDLRIELVRRQRGFRTFNENGVLVVKFYNDEQVATERIFDFPVLPEKLSNYPNEENPTRTFHLHGIWSCNKVIEHFGKIIAYGSKEMPDTMFISAPEDVSLFYFPHLFTKQFYTDAKEPLNSVIPFSNILVAQTANRTWGIKGNSALVFLDENAQVENPNAYRVFDINTAIGTIAHKSVKPVRNQLYFLSNQGIMSLVSLYATDDKYNVRPVDRNINNIVPLDKTATAIQHDNQYWISFPKTGELFRYYIDTQAWVKDSFENFEEFNGWFWMDTNNGVLRFVTRPMIINQDDNYTVYEGIVDKSLPTDFDKNITSEFLTANLDQDQAFHTKRYRELKMSFAVQNQFLPPLQPIENVTSEINNEYIVEFDGTLRHIYNVEFSLPFTQAMYEGEGRPDYFDLGDLEVLSVKGENNEPLEWETKPDNTIDIYVGNYEGKVTLTVRDNEGNIIQDTDVIVTDVTYDFNIVGSVVAESDGQIINRVTFEQYKLLEGEIVTADNLPVAQSLGTRFRVFDFGDTPFGDVKRNVQTVRLAGTGYQLALYMKDESRTKWTLETLGIQFRMRKTRSR
jgi:hypothetical protein